MTAYPTAAPPARSTNRGTVPLALFVAVATWLGGCNATDDRPPLWEYISPALFQPNCATSSCHSRAAAVAGLDFSDPERGYTSLTGLWIWIVDPNGTAMSGCRPLNETIVCQRPGRPLVTPFNPQQSRVVNMLRAQSTSRMPPDRPLPEADIALVERWILNGALRTVSGPGPGDAGSVGDGGADRPGDGPAADASGTDGAGALNDVSGVGTQALDGGTTDVRVDAAADLPAAPDGRDS